MFTVWIKPLGFRDGEYTFRQRSYVISFSIQYSIFSRQLRWSLLWERQLPLLSLLRLCLRLLGRPLQNPPSYCPTLWH